MTTTLFCGRCNATTEHASEVANSEIQFNCQTEGCVGFQKVGVVSSKEELTAWIETHNSVNKPAVTQADLEAKDAALHALLS